MSESTNVPAESTEGENTANPAPEATPTHTVESVGETLGKVSAAFRLAFDAIVDKANSVAALNGKLAASTGDTDKAVAALIDTDESDEAVAYRKMRDELAAAESVLREKFAAKVAENVGDPEKIKAELSEANKALTADRKVFESTLKMVKPELVDAAMSVIPATKVGGKSGGTGTRVSSGWRIYGFAFSIDGKPVSEKINGKDGQNNSVAAAKALAISPDTLRDAFGEKFGKESKSWADTVTLEIADKDGKVRKVKAVRQEIKRGATTAGDK